MDPVVVDFIWQAAAGGLVAEAAVAPIRRTLGQVFPRLQRLATKGDKEAFEEELKTALHAMPAMEANLQQIFDDLPDETAKRVIWRHQIAHAAIEIRLLTDRLWEALRSGAKEYSHAEARTEILKLHEISKQVGPDYEQLVIQLSDRFNAWMELIREQSAIQQSGGQPDYALIDQKHRDLYDWFNRTFNQTRTGSPRPTRTPHVQPSGQKRSSSAHADSAEHPKPDV